MPKQALTISSGMPTEKLVGDPLSKTTDQIFHFSDAHVILPFWKPILILYELQKQKLQQNLNYLNTLFINRKGFTFNVDYPVIYFEDESVSKKLLENKIITTSFKYTNTSGKLNRIVITANHTNYDLEQLVAQLNSRF